MSDEKISDFPTWVGGIVPPAGQVPFIFGGVNYKASWTQITGPTLGLGTMAYQNSDAVSITGGSVATSALSGTVAIANGGTAASTVPAARVNLLPPYAGNAGKVLALDVTGTDVQWIPAPGTGTVTSVNVSGGTTGLGTTGGPVTTTGTITLSGTLNAASGGTGLSSYAIGDIVYASGAAALTRLADVATGNALLSGGVGIAPAYGKVGLTTHVSGVLPPANGGTGISTALTPGSVVFAGPGGVLAEDNANLFFDDTNNNLGIGGTPNANGRVGVLGNATGSTFKQGYRANQLIKSDVTGEYSSFLSSPSTDAAVFTIANLVNFKAQNITAQGAGSVITNQHGFFAASNMSSAVNNYGFYGELVAGAGRYNLYMNGTADNYMAGSLGLGTSAGLSNIKLRLSGIRTGSVNQYMVYSDPTIASDVTNLVATFNSNIATQAAAFNVTTLRHYMANGASLGAGSSITEQFGFLVEASLTTATTNYGFCSNIPAGTNRWNFYAAGTADNYMAGRLGVGAPAGSNVKFGVFGNTSPGPNSYGNHTQQIIQPDVTSEYSSYVSVSTTAATPFNLTYLVHYKAQQNTIGAGSTVGNQFGFYAQASMTGGSVNIGFYTDMAAGANRFGFYSGGTVDNIFAGATRIGSTAAPTVTLDVSGAIVASGGIATSSFIRTGVYTVATLPSAAGAGQGARTFVTDANSITFGTPALSGGTSQVPVYSNGSSWGIG